MKQKKDKTQTELQRDAGNFKWPNIFVIETLKGRGVQKNA